jgi:hypothetical protein
MAGKKKPVQGTFEGLCGPGDRVRCFFVDGAGHIDTEVDCIDSCGDIQTNDPIGEIVTELCSHVMILRRADPPAEKTFSGVLIDIAPGVFRDRLEI